VCVLLLCVCVRFLDPKPQNALLEYTSDAAGDGGSSTDHDCADATAADDDDDIAITRLTRHIRVFGTT
jgi:hypothetical protein